jgi:2-polyprenyl-6-methoxyphenol hydroxylase-like FAD-dependent oxidoreductase
MRTRARAPRPPRPRVSARGGSGGGGGGGALDATACNGNSGSQRVVVLLRLALADALTHPRARAALVGDAARSMHPLAEQGVNQGLLDAAALGAALVRATRTGGDAGGASMLAEYEAARGAPRRSALTPRCGPGRAALSSRSAPPRAAAHRARSSVRAACCPRCAL